MTVERHIECLDYSLNPFHRVRNAQPQVVQQFLYDEREREDDAGQRGKANPTGSCELHHSLVNSVVPGDKDGNNAEQSKTSGAGLSKRGLGMTVERHIHEVCVST